MPVPHPTFKQEEEEEEEEAYLFGCVCLGQRKCNGQKTTYSKALGYFLFRKEKQVLFSFPKGNDADLCESFLRKRLQAGVFSLEPFPEHLIFSRKTGRSFIPGFQAQSWLPREALLGSSFSPALRQRLAWEDLHGPPI